MGKYALLKKAYVIPCMTNHNNIRFKMLYIKLKYLLILVPVYMGFFICLFCGFLGHFSQVSLPNVCMLFFLPCFLQLFVQGSSIHAY